VLPAAFSATIAAALFGAAALVLVPTGVIELATEGTSVGAGNPLSAGIVAGVAFLASAAVLWRSVRTRPA
jgi:hypothetical protein